MVALPKLNNTPQYSLTIPSIDKKVYYRPYLVKEEKILLMASESQDPAHMFKSLVDTVNACIQDDISKEELTVFDIEYIFTQLRAKSSGETIKFKPKCKIESCGAENEAELSLEDIKVNIPEVDPVIKLTDKIHLRMKWPSYRSLFGNKDLSKLNEADQAFNMIQYCVDSVITEEESISAKDVSEKELSEFIESLTSDQFKLIRDYVDKIPKLKHDINYECKECGQPNTIHLEGLRDFF